MSQKKIIIDYLTAIGNWIPEYKLRSVDTPYGWLGFQADRRCRELVKEGILERKLNKSNRYYYAEFRIINSLKDMPPKQEPTNMSYDEQLKNILFVTKPTWNNTNKIKEIEKAIKSNNEYYKKSIIEKYR